MRRNVLRKRNYRRKARANPRKGKQSNLKRIVKRQVKALIPRPEMKAVYASAPTGFSLGQVNANSPGFVVVDVNNNIFNMSQGSGAATRIGAEIFLKGIYITMFLQQQSATTVSVNHKLVLLWTEDTTTNINTFVQQMYRSNSISTVVDYNSPLAPEAKGTYKIVYQTRFKTSSDQYSGVNPYINKKIFVKQRRYLRWTTAGGASLPINGRYLMVLLSDGGNISGTASTITSIPFLAANTGFTGWYNFSGYFNDN